MVGRKKTKTGIKLTIAKLNDLLQPLNADVIAEMNTESYRKENNIYSRLCLKMNMRNCLKKSIKYILDLEQIFKYFD